MIREIFDRQSIDVELGVKMNENGELEIEIVQARYMVQQDFPVRGQFIAAQEVLGDVIGMMTSIGIEKIMDVNRMGAERDIDGLIAVAQESPELAPFISDAIAKVIRFSGWDKAPEMELEESAFLKKIIPFFEENGIFYNLYAKPVFHAIFAYKSLHTVINQMIRRDVLPKSMHRKIYDKLSTLNTGGLGHIYYLEAQNAMLEAIDRLERGDGRFLKKINPNEIEKWKASPEQIQEWMQELGPNKLEIVSDEPSEVTGQERVAQWKENEAQINQWRELIQDKLADVQDKTSVEKLKNQVEALDPDFEDPETDLLKLNIARKLNVDFARRDRELVRHLANENIHVRERALRYIRNENILADAATDFRVKREIARENQNTIHTVISNILSNVLHVVYKSHPEVSETDINNAFYWLLMEFPESVESSFKIEIAKERILRDEVHYYLKAGRFFSEKEIIDRYAPDTQDIKTAAEKAKANGFLKRTFQQKILLTDLARILKEQTSIPDELTEIDRTELPDDVRTRFSFFEVMKPGEIGVLIFEDLIKLAHDYVSNTAAMKRYNDAIDEIQTFRSRKESMQDRASQVVSMAKLIGHDFPSLTVTPVYVEAIAKMYGFEEDSELEASIDEYLRDFSRVKEMLLDFARPDSGAYLVPPTPEELKYPSKLFQTFRETSYFLMHAQDASPILVDFMMSTLKMVELAEKLSAEKEEEGTHVPRGLEHLEKASDTASKLITFTRRLWKLIAYSPFEHGYIYSLPEDLKEDEESEGLDARKAIDEIIFFHKHLDYIKQHPDLVIVQEAEENLPILDQEPLDFDLIIVNLVRNALEQVRKIPDDSDKKVTIRTSTYRNPDDPSRDGIIVQIEDTGPGFSESIMPHIFDPTDVQVIKDEVLGDERVSVGGLGIAKRLVEKTMGGSLEVQNKEGVGTAFTLRIPISAKSLGSDTAITIESLLEDRYQLKDEAFRQDFSQKITRKIQADSKQIARAVPAGEPALIVMEGLEGLPPSLNSLEAILSKEQYLVIVDLDRDNNALKEAIIQKYGVLPSQIIVKGLKDKPKSQALALLPSQIGSELGIDFEDRIGFVLQEENKSLVRQVSKLTYPHRVLYAPASPNELVLPLSFHIVSNEGKVADEFLDYVTQRGDQVFQILILDELVRQMLIQSEADRLMATAA